MHEKKETHLYLVRHGETDWNAEKRIQGSIERSLNEQGKAQAEQTGKTLSQIGASVIYSSPQIRAKETAEIIGKHFPHTLHFHAQLREGEYGSAEGMTRDEFQSYYRRALDQKKSLPKEEKLKFKIVPDGESSFELASRLHPALLEIAQKHVGEKIIVVTHGFAMRALIAYVSTIDEEDISISNGGIVLFKATHHHQGRLQVQSLPSQFVKRYSAYKDYITIQSE
jgi:broad specificity phosphatase PhoE